MTTRVPGHQSIAVTLDHYASAVGWLTRGDVIELLAGLGQPCAVTTWAAYVSRGQAPRPVRTIGRTPLWDAADVRAWAASRPRAGGGAAS